MNGTPHIEAEVQHCCWQHLCLLDVICCEMFVEFADPIVDVIGSCESEGHSEF